MFYNIRLVLLMLMAVVSASVATARTVSFDEARRIASDVMGEKSLVKVGVKTSANDDAVARPYYIFNSSTQGNGFVIISGDDRAQRILGYSDTGIFDPDNIPPQLADLLVKYAAEISSIDNRSTHPSWGTSSRIEDGILLETANWGQGEPYNALSPEFDGQHSPAGCVATAMAIVMKYHSWPKQAYGNPRYHLFSTGEEIDEDLSKYSFDWELMPAEYTQGDNGDEISKLMYAAGISVNMDYRQDESAAYMFLVGHALRHHFCYAPSCEFISHDNYTQEEWRDIIKAELNDNRPVIYGGNGAGGGHTFVCDGYNSTGLFHFNWGWNGIANGYFSLSAIDPLGSDYTDYQSMVIGISPDQSCNHYSSVTVDYGYEWMNDIRKEFAEPGLEVGCHVNVSEIKNGEPFDFCCRMINVPYRFSGKVGVALVDEQGRIKEVLNTVDATSTVLQRAPQNVYFRQNLVTETINPTDRIQLVAYENADACWRVVLGTSEATSSVPVVGNIAEEAIVVLDSDYGRVTLGSENDVELNESINNLTTGASLFCHAPMGESAVIIIKKNGELLKTIFPFTNQSGYPDCLILQSGVYNIDICPAVVAPLELALEEPGTLEQVMPLTAAVGITELTLSGNVDVRDLKYIKENCGFLNVLDLSDAKIHSYVSSDQVESCQEDCIPEGAFRILDYFYRFCFLKEIYLPKSLKVIGDKAFVQNGLTQLNLPETLDKLGENAFAYNEDLRQVSVHWQNPIDCDYPFSGTRCEEDGILYVPSGTYDKYRSHPVWGRFKEIVEKDDADLRVYNNVISGAFVFSLYAMDHSATVTGFDSSGSHVTIPTTVSYKNEEYAVNKIAREVFRNNIIIESVEMPEGIIEIGKQCFDYCTNLKRVKLPVTLKKVPGNSFSYCTALEDIDLSNLEELGMDAFSNCHSIKKIHMRNNWDFSAHQAFKNMAGLEEITVDPENPHFTAVGNILYSKDMKTLLLVPGQQANPLTVPDGVETIGELSLCNMQYVEKIHFPESIIEMGYRCIEHNPCLTHITIPDRVKNTNSEFIAYCDNLKSITIGEDFQGGAGIHQNPIERVYLKNNRQVDIPQLFNSDYYFSFYSSSLIPNAKLNDCMAFYVPGKASANYIDLPGISEMWDYKLNRNECSVQITPMIEDLVIDKVSINGKNVEPEAGNVYHYENPQGRAADNPDIVVDYTLHGLQHMTTHYTPEFNAELLDSELSGVTPSGSVDNEMSVKVSGSTVYISGAAENSYIGIYDIAGNVIYYGTQSMVCGLASGIYIVAVEGHAFKIVIKEKQ